MSTVATDQVTSPPPVARTNSASISLAANTAGRADDESTASVDHAQRPATYVLVLCDGTRSRDEILAALVDGAARGDFVLHQDAQPLSDPTALRELLGSRLPNVLKDLARLAFLTAE